MLKHLLVLLVVDKSSNKILSVFPYRVPILGVIHHFFKFWHIFKGEPLRVDHFLGFHQVAYKNARKFPLLISFNFKHEYVLCHFISNL